MRFFLLAVLFSFSLFPAQVEPQIPRGNRFKLIKKIAENIHSDDKSGNFLHLCFDEQTHELVVIKAAVGTAIKLLANEAIIYEQTKGMPHVIKHYGTIVEAEIRFELLEYCPSGDLLERMSRNKDEFHNLMVQLVHAVNTLHEKFICHFDIKPQNILLIGSALKLADFGLSSFRPKGDRYAWGSAGTECIRAPEVAQSLTAEMGFNIYKADVFSLGATIFWLFFGEPVFDEIGKERHIDFLRKGPKTIIEERAKQLNIVVDEDLADLLENMLRIDPVKRFAMSDVLEHAWIKPKEIRFHSCLPFKDANPSKKVKKKKFSLMAIFKKN